MLVYVYETNENLRMTRDEALLHARSLADKLGCGLDEEMIEPVAAFYLLGIKTHASCAGHKDRGHSYPWIRLDAGEDERLFLEKRLPSFHLVKQGRFPGTYRLLPKEVASISSEDPCFDWQEHRLELAMFAQEILADYK